MKKLYDRLAIFRGCFPAFGQDRLQASPYTQQAVLESGWIDSMQIEWLLFIITYHEQV